MKIKLDFKVIPDACQGEDAYASTHVFFVSENAFDHASNALMKTSNTEFSHSFDTLKDPTPDRTAVCVDLIFTMKNYLGKDAQKRVGSATVFLRDLVAGPVNVPLVHNTSGVTKGHVTIWMKQKIPISDGELGFPDDTQISASIRRSTRDLVSKVQYVSGFCSRIMMPVFKTRIGKSVPGRFFVKSGGLEIDDNTLAKWLYDASFRHNDTIHTRDKQVAGDILATCCAIYPTTCTYITDKVWNKHKVIHSDTFESTTITHSGDCEDLARVATKVFEYILNRPMRGNKDLCRLTKVAHRYSCLLTLGEVTRAGVGFSDKTQMAHMWAMLVPKSRIVLGTKSHDRTHLIECTGRVHPDINHISKGNPPNGTQALLDVSTIDFYKHVVEAISSDGKHHFLVASKGVSQPVVGVPFNDFVNGDFIFIPKRNEPFPDIDRILSFEHPEVIEAYEGALSETFRKRNDAYDVAFSDASIVGCNCEYGGINCLAIPI